MTTSIKISGQTSGNFILRNAIITSEAKESSSFNDINLTFPTKAAAKKALWEAFKTLCSDKEDAAASRLSYSKYGSLRYDASQASIMDHA